MLYKPTFLGYHNPLITNMIQPTDPENFISIARNAVTDGAAALGCQICKLEPKYRTGDTFKYMFSYADDKPIYITNYRSAFSEKQTDDERLEDMLTALSAGATLCDIMGDMFDPTKHELTTNPAAIDKQKRVIDKIHSMGGEVLMSSHTYEFLPCERVVEMAVAQQERGADIAKIVTASNTEEELLENLHITAELKKELKIPYLFLSVGSHCKIHRHIGPMLGCCMWLTVERYHDIDTKLQPRLRSLRNVVNNFDYKPTRTF